MRGGARKVRAMTISRSDLSSMKVSFMGVSNPLSSTMGFLLPLFLELFVDELIHALEPRVPEMTVLLQPFMKLAEGLRAQRVEPLLRMRLHLHQPRLFQREQVL